MRIDQYLWCVRYFKSRNIASNACKKGQVKINEQVVKPSREVLRQDKLEIRKDQILYQCTVLDIPKSRLGAKLVDIYRMDTTPRSAFEQKELQRLSQDYYREKGEGRPTKRDREIETNLTYVIQKMHQLKAQLSSPLKDTKMQLHTKEAQTETVNTSLERELVYCLDHAIHHQALIKIGLKEQNLSHLVSQDFGVAYSTLRFRTHS